jgi:hypothetical protein
VSIHTPARHSRRDAICRLMFVVTSAFTVSFFLELSGLPTCLTVELFIGAVVGVVSALAWFVFPPRERVLVLICGSCGRSFRADLWRAKDVA